MTTRRMAQRPRLVAAITSLLIAGCGGTTTTPALPSTAPPEASSSASSSTVPATDVKAAFLDVITDPKFSGTAALSGTIALAGIDGEVSGDWAFDGRDSHMTTTIALPGSEQTNESVTIGPDGWERSGEGPWLEREKKPDRGKSFTGMLAVLNALEDLGVESRDGVELHHFQPPAGGRVPADALGIDNADIRSPKATADFYTTDAGVPEIFAFHITWTQAIGGQDAAVTMDMQLDIDDVGTSQPIEPPAEAEIWTRYTSSFGYRMAHPPEWTARHTKTEDSFLIDDQPYVYVAPRTLPAGATLSSFQRDLIASYHAQFGTDPESRESTRIGGSAAFRLTYHFKNDANQDVALVDVATLHGGRGWEVFILTLAGETEADDIGVFDDFVSTFNFTK